MSVSRGARRLVAVGLSGECPRCGGPARWYDDRLELVGCDDCGREWPSSYWEEQADA